VKNQHGTAMLLSFSEDDRRDMRHSRTSE